MSANCRPLHGRPHSCVGVLSLFTSNFKDPVMKKILALSFATLVLSCGGLESEVSADDSAIAQDSSDPADEPLAESQSRLGATGTTFYLPINVEMYQYGFYNGNTN